MGIWRDRRVLVTGGASFIGSHLVDHLLSRGARVSVADDFSSGSFGHLGSYGLRRESQQTWRADSLVVRKGNLTDAQFARQAMDDVEVVFHLAASHGGRGYIESHPAECCTNMILDQLALKVAHEAGVQRFCFASSACVYPRDLQHEPGSAYLLKEDDADPFVRGKSFADLEYGWAKFMGEMALRAYHRQYGMKTAAARIFTAYGPRENETHAIIALIAKAFVRCDPYPIWGTGEQDRNFTYVQDIAEGLVRVCEVVEDGSAVNVGREDRITLNQAAELVFQLIGWRPQHIEHDLSKPTGVASRAADLARARSVLNWEPQVSYREGFASTIDWYVSTKDRDDVTKRLEYLLTERGVNHGGHA